MPTKQQELQVATANEDWLKRTWDLPTTIDKLVEQLGPERLSKLHTLPVWNACPPDLKRKIQIFIATTKKAKERRG